MGLYRIKAEVVNLPLKKVLKTQRIDQKSDQHISTSAGGIAKGLTTEYPPKGRIKEVNNRQDQIPDMMQSFTHSSKVID